MNPKRTGSPVGSAKPVEYLLPNNTYYLIIPIT